MSLTDLQIKIPRGARSGVVRKIFTEAEVSQKWEKTAWAKKLVARKKKASMTDFDRFKLKLAKQRVSVLYCFMCEDCPRLTFQTEGPLSEM